MRLCETTPPSGGVPWNIAHAGMPTGSTRDYRPCGNTPPFGGVYIQRTKGVMDYTSFLWCFARGNIITAPPGAYF